MASGLPAILLHTDAAQAVGKRRVDVGELGVDFLTIVGHKVHPQSPHSSVLHLPPKPWAMGTGSSPPLPWGACRGETTDGDHDGDDGAPQTVGDKSQRPGSAMGGRRGLH